MIRLWSEFGLTGLDEVPALVAPQLCGTEALPHAMPMSHALSTDDETHRCSIKPFSLLLSLSPPPSLVYQFAIRIRLRPAGRLPAG